MIAAPNAQLISVDDYLAAELLSPIKHEYLGGMVYAVADERNLHNLIASSVLGTLHSRVRGSGYRAWNSSTKIRIRLPTHIRFYYPAASVIRRSNSPLDCFQDKPVAIAEVLSRQTRRIDEQEKKDAYLTIPSLSAYLLVEQESPTVVVHRRTEMGFVREVYTGLDAVVPLPEIGAELPLAEIYDGVEFVSEPEHEEAG